MSAPGTGTIHVGRRNANPVTSAAVETLVDLGIALGLPGSVEASNDLVTITYSRADLDDLITTLRRLKEATT